MIRKIIAFTLPVFLVLLSKTAFPTNLPIGTLTTLPAPSASPSDSFPVWNSTAGSADKVYLYDLVNLPPFQTEFSYLDPMTTVGDLIYENATPAPARLGGNTTTTKNFLCGTGTGSAANAPSWCTLSSGDIPNNAANTTGTAANLAGIYAVPSPGPSGDIMTATGSSWIAALAPTGLPSPTPSGDILTATGTSWIASLPPTGLPSPTPSGDVLTATGTSWIAASVPVGFTNPMTTLGDIIYGGSSGTAAALHGNTSTSREFLLSAGTGSAANTPSYSLLTSVDIPNNAANTSGTAAGLSATLVYGSGGTNATTQSAAQANMSPETTKGDTTIYTTAPARQAAPGDYGALIPDSNQTNGWRSASYTMTNGKPTKNYIQYADMENGNASTPGWALGTIGTLTNGLPTGTPNFSGSTSNLTFGAENGVALAGSWSMSYNASAATTVGNMLATSSIAIDPEDQGKVLAVRYFYEPLTPANGNWSGTSSNSYAWAVYDVTNSVWLSSVGNFCMMQSSGIGKCEGASFQTGATTANIRFIIYNVTATTGVENLILDDFYIGPQMIPSGFAGSDWTSYTPVITGASSSPTEGTNTQSAQWRRVGANMEINFNYQQSGAGSGGSGTYLFSLPSGYSINTSLVKISTSATGNDGQAVGVASASNTVAASTTAATIGFVVPYNSTNLSMYVTNAASELVSVGSGQYALSQTTIYYSFHAQVPISGWSSNTQISSDSSPNVITATYGLTTGTTPSANAVLKYDTLIKDTNGMYSTSTGLSTVPISGSYVLAIQSESGSAYDMYVKVNGTSKGYILGAPTGGQVYSGSLTLPLNAGDTVGVYTDASVAFGAPSTNGYLNQFTITKVSGSNAVQAPPTVAFEYYGSSQTLTTSYAPIVFTTKLLDTMGIMNTGNGLATAPYTGTYHCTCRFGSLFSVSSNIVAQFYVGGSSTGTQLHSIGNSNTVFLMADDLPVLAGQTIGCEAEGTNAGSGSIYDAAFSCHRLGY